MLRYVKTLREITFGDKNPDKYGAALGTLIHELVYERDIAISMLSMTVGKSPQELLDAIRDAQKLFD
jgi:hypothetical protein